ncbi:Putative short-chain dehydrogenase/reductase SDR, NAD(P)-binding domain superfamily [Septoria linicola]|uniref:Short-chain dehydrogenase/reductase SDR, NAD(P)-binding domain superfamily n=1 Tax=Septoria linicola TaxID=215465 RepID=A0A9Q9ACE4_9PEZI|nr:putative short-chain dehydrogenase/reductase SDR, NAD(P)-binding domain superfamily [Septoria linicola]USW46969.1 Putative short-chain dehydrogenase/reductase SDR, NAD(P)-binding domain superfamily [Septoria linicola]
MAPLVFLISAASSGFGKGIALEALARGHKVIATARQKSRLSDLEARGATTLSLDVTQPLPELHSIVAEAHAIHSRIDILVNPAGYILEGSLEEASPEETYDCFNVNVFGVLNLARAVLPYMRAQRSGTIAHFGSVGSWGGVPGAAIYGGVKWAIAGLTESLREEVKPFGIEVVSIEPGYFRTGFLNPGARHFTKERFQDYEDTLVGMVRAALEEKDNAQLGNIELGSKVCVDVLTKHEGQAVPVRLVLGSDAYGMIKTKCEDTIQLLEEWKDVTCSTDHVEG